MIRGVIFKFFFYLGTTIICIVFLPALVLPQRIDLFAGKILAHWIRFCLFIFLSVKVKVKGVENIPKDQPFFIASLHQSLFETFFLQAIFNSPVFILKKELLNIPIFGWHLRKIGSISVDRDRVSRENLGFYDKIVSITTKTKRPVIIFPQATRTSVDIKLPFKKGVSKIYEKLNFVCVPVALNSGDVWPKSGALKANKTITVSILNYIPIGLEGEQFLNKIEKDLYSALDEIR
tara:strand:+ start:7952 stop:8653 length:702 start_codon:yes stop_codon:yes gene_type:complete